MAETLFLGTYTEPILFGTGDILPGKGAGIHIARLDDNGRLSEIGRVENVRNPSFLCFSPDNAFLYAVNELKEYEGKPEGAVSAFAVETADGKTTLRFLNSRPTGGTDPCHVIAAPDGSHVYVSNFMSGSVAAFPVRADGTLGEASDFIQYEGSSINARRQKSPHAHSLVFDPAGKRAFVPDLGTDKLMIYEPDFATGKLVPASPGFYSCAPGDGPRFLEFHPGGKWFYLINEIASSLSVIQYEAATGAMHLVQIVSTIPEGFDKEQNICADVHVTQDGRFVYASNRGHDSIAVFYVNPADGTLEWMGNVRCGGKTPRNFALSLSGEFLIVANQDTDNLLSFRIQPDGCLVKVDAIAVPTPVCVRPAAL